MIREPYHRRPNQSNRVRVRRESKLYRETYTTNLLAARMCMTVSCNRTVWNFAMLLAHVWLVFDRGNYKFDDVTRGARWCTAVFSSPLVRSRTAFLVSKLNVRGSIRLIKRRFERKRNRTDNRVTQLKRKSRGSISPVSNLFLNLFHLDV